jgi:hypothetical protein
MRQIVALIAVFFALFVTINCQLFTFGTFSDGSCAVNQEYSIESNGGCINLGGIIQGPSVNITLSGTTGTLYYYTGANCQGASANNVSYTVGTCASFPGGGSFIINNGQTIWSQTQYFSYSSNCGGTTPYQVFILVANVSGSMCAVSNCTCTGTSFCRLTTCSLSAPSCLSQNILQSQVFNQAGCAASALTVQSCILPNICLNTSASSSFQFTCSGTSFGGGSYNQANCQGNITSSLNATGSCAPNGQGYYTTSLCNSPSTTSTTTGGTNNAAIVTFSLLSVLSMLCLYFLI